MIKDYKRFRSEVKKHLHKIIVAVSDEAIDWFYELSKTMKESGGYKLPRSYIVRALINTCMKLDINVKGIKTEEELEERILEAVKNSFPLKRKEVKRANLEGKKAPLT